MEYEDTRSRATLTFTVKKFSEMENPIFSRSTMICNYPWNIMVRRTKSIHGDGLGFFLRCNANSKSLSWSCYADARLIILSQNGDIDDFSRKIEHNFCFEENDWGFSHFISWKDVTDPCKGFIKYDTIKLEAQVTAHSPLEICDDSEKLSGRVTLQMQTATRNDNAASKLENSNSEDAGKADDNISQKPEVTAISAIISNPSEVSGIGHDVESKLAVGVAAEERVEEGQRQPAKGMENTGETCTVAASNIRPSSPPPPAAGYHFYLELVKIAETALEQAGELLTAECPSEDMYATQEAIKSSIEDVLRASTHLRPEDAARAADAFTQLRRMQLKLERHVAAYERRQEERVVREEEEEERREGEAEAATAARRRRVTRRRMLAAFDAICALQCEKNDLSGQLAAITLQLDDLKLKIGQKTAHINLMRANFCDRFGVTYDEYAAANATYDAAVRGQLSSDGAATSSSSSAANQRNISPPA